MIVLVAAAGLSLGAIVIATIAIRRTATAPTALNVESLVRPGIVIARIVIKHANLPSWTRGCYWRRHFVSPIKSEPHL